MQRATFRRVTPSCGCCTPSMPQAPVLGPREFTFYHNVARCYTCWVGIHCALYILINSICIGLWLFCNNSLYSTNHVGRLFAAEWDRVRLGVEYFLWKIKYSHISRKLLLWMFYLFIKSFHKECLHYTHWWILIQVCRCQLWLTGMGAKIAFASRDPVPVEFSSKIKFGFITKRVTYASLNKALRMD